MPSLRLSVSVDNLLYRLMTHIPSFPMERWDFFVYTWGRGSIIGRLRTECRCNNCGYGQHRPAEEIETYNRRKSDWRAIMERTECEDEDRRHLSTAYRIMTPYKTSPKALSFSQQEGDYWGFRRTFNGGQLFEFVSSRNGGSGDNLLSDYPAPFSMLSCTYLKIDNIKIKI